MAKKKRILIDMDGILCDLLSKWVATYNFETGDELLVSDITAWGVEHFMTRAVRPKEMIKRPGFFDDLMPIHGAVGAVKTLVMAGHDIRICSTPAGPDSARAKLDWCRRHLDLDESSVILTHDKHWIDADVLIDDKPANIRAWAARGKKAMTIAYPYNECVGHLCFRSEGYQDPNNAWVSILEELWC